MQTGSWGEFSHHFHQPETYKCWNNHQWLCVLQNVPGPYQEGNSNDSSSSHCKQMVNTHGYMLCTGCTLVPLQLGYKDKCSWGTSGYGQPPNRVLPCVGEVPRQCMTPGYNTYTGCTWTHHLMYTDRATWPGYIMYTFGVAPSVQSLHGNPFPLSYTNHGP